MRELARPSAFLLPLVVVLVVVMQVGCAPEGARSCHSDNQCEDGDECVFDEDGEVGVCLAALLSDDDGGDRPVDGGDDGGVPGMDGGGSDDGGGPGTDGGSHDAGGPDTRVNDITVGGGFACARTYDDHAYCWGFNREGQLGNPNDMLDGVQQPRRVAGLSEVGALAAAERHACAVGRAFGQRGVFCWGSSAEGELGGEPGQSPGVPHRVPLPSDVHEAVVDLQTGSKSTCVRTSDSDVWCWGPDVPDYRPGTPVQVTKLQPALRLHVSDGAICAKLAGSNGVRCLDQLGILQDLCRRAGGERECDDLYDAASFQFTASNACRIDGSDNGGALFCGGDNRYGIAHPSTPGLGKLAFTPLEEWLPFSSRQVALGEHHACVLGNDGEVRCWGRNRWSVTGQADDLGEPCGTEQERCHEPLAVPGLPSMTDIDTFRFFTCAISEDAAPWCWGRLGDDSERPARWAIPADEAEVGAPRR